MINHTVSKRSSGGWSWSVENRNSQYTSVTRGDCFTKWGALRNVKRHIKLYALANKGALRDTP